MLIANLFILKTALVMTCPKGAIVKLIAHSGMEDFKEGASIFVFSKVTFYVPFVKDLISFL